VLRNQSKSPSIYVSSVIDPYQPIESKENWLCQLLEVIIAQSLVDPKLRSPIIIRDIDLYKDLALTN